MKKATRVSALIRQKLKEEKPLSRKETAELFKDKPEIIALLEQADFVIGLIKRI